MKKNKIVIKPVFREGLSNAIVVVPVLLQKNKEERNINLPS